MLTSLNDNRKCRAMTVQEADALFAEIARIELEIAKLASAGDRELARVKEKWTAQMEPLKAELPEKCKALSEYIAAHPERFQKPRARKTAEGQYGLRNVSNLAVEDETGILHWSVAQNRTTEFFEISYKLLKKAVEKALAEGVEIPGASIESGEKSFYKVAQELLSAAKNG